MGIRIARRELAPGMVEKLAMQVVHTIELLGSNQSSGFRSALKSKVKRCFLRVYEGQSAC